MKYKFILFLPGYLKAQEVRRLDTWRRSQALHHREAVHKARGLH